MQPLLALLAVWVLLVAIGFAVWPLFAGARDEVDRRELALRDLEAEKARLLEDLHELELDHETGKLSEEDYRANRTRLRSQAVDVMREIEELRGDAPETREASASDSPREEVDARSSQPEMAESSG